MLFAFLKKEFHHIFRDVRTLIIIIGIPIAQLLIFGYVTNNDLKDIRYVVFDQSADNTTKQIIDKVASSGYFLYNGNINELNNVEKAFKSGQAKFVLVFERDFEKNFTKEGLAKVQLILDASDPNQATLVSVYVSNIINSYVKEKKMKNVTIHYEIKMDTRMMFNESLKSAFLFIPGLMAMILMLISAMMTSLSITKEKELGTMEILLVSPLKPYMIIIGKVIPYFLISIINAIVILTIGYFVFEVPINGNIILLFAETMLFILMALSLGIAISTIAKNQMTAMFVSIMGLMMPTMLLSGYIYSIENMPYPLQLLSNIMPARWFIVMLKDVMLKGNGIQYIIIENLILIFMTLVFIMISVKKFKIRLE